MGYLDDNNIPLAERPLSETEARARQELLDLCSEIGSEYGGMVYTDQLDEPDEDNGMDGSECPN